MKKLMKVYVIFDTAYQNEADAIKIEDEWSHKETIKERYMYACEDDKEAFDTEYGKQVLVYGEYFKTVNEAAANFLSE